MSASSKKLLRCSILIERLAKMAMHRSAETPLPIGKTDLEKSVNLLRSIEWSMGNGQCFFCCGCRPRKRWWTEKVGHEKNCDLAVLLSSLGEKPSWTRKNRSKARFDMERWSRESWERMKQCASDPSQARS